jgi:proline iminopeptidase
MAETKDPIRLRCRALTSGLLALVALCSLSGCVNAPAPAPGAEQVTKGTLAEQLRIGGPNGLDISEMVDIRGTRQWISIRGKDRRNPVILLVHGGPGSPLSPLAWTFQPGWEDHFTVVQWDQRGAGKSHAALSGEAPLTIDLMARDLTELTAFIRERLGKEKVFLVAHSWGTVIGLRLAQEHPEWLHAYVGIGQLLDSAENERQGLGKLKAMAAAAGDQAALSELAAIEPYPEPDGSLPLAKLRVVRKWVSRYNGMTYGKRAISSRLRALSPDYTGEDLAAYSGAEAKSAERLLPEIAQLRLGEQTSIQCPVFIWMGEHDLATSPEIARDWVAQVDAPAKQYALLPNASHMVFTEVPGLVLEGLLTQVRPLAISAGDGPAESVFKPHRR